MGAHLVRSGFQLRSGGFNLDRTDKFQVWERVSQADHGLTAGKVIYHDGTGYVTAKADAAATAEAIGIVAQASTDEFVYVQSGRITGLTNSMLDTGSITAGTVYYLSAANAGKLTADEPASGNVVKPMLVATSATSGIVLNYLGTIAVQTNFEKTLNVVDSPVLLDSFADTDSFGCAWHVAVRDANSTVFRTGTVLATWNAGASGSGSAEYTEVSTKELGGSTSDVSFTVEVNGSNVVELRAVNGGSSTGWKVRAKRILI